MRNRPRFLNKPRAVKDYTLGKRKVQEGTLGDELRKLVLLDWVQNGTVSLKNLYLEECN